MRSKRDLQDSSPQLAGLTAGLGGEGRLGKSIMMANLAATSCGKGPRGRLGLRPRCVVARVLALCLTLGTFVAAGRAGAQPATSSNPAPTWWGKYTALFSLASPDDGPASPTSLTVGPNIDVSNEPGPQSETSIAINPENSKEIVAGSNEIFRLPMRGYFSSDGGATWAGVDLPLPPPTQSHGIDFGSDPGVAWDTLGNVHYSYIVVFFSKGFVGVVGTEMAVARSSDGGRTWTATYFAFQTGGSKFNDKPMITVDTNPGSAFPNRVYVAWDAASGPAGIQVSRSADHGATFST